ncbi:MAG: hypothetical protein JNN27_14580 [Planctomycetes bacterium]|nr:hypothetical protein [Planctomycetota bacterium]
MNPSCIEFRARLAQALAERPVAELAWHEHVLTCNDCRELLDAEEALDDLLASLPRPNLPPELARRVIARLAPERELDRLLDRALDRALGGSLHEARPQLAGELLARLAAPRELAARERELDQLLDRVPAVARPELARELLARLAPVREAARAERALDALLERVPPPQIPGDLAPRTLAALAPERAPAPVPAPARARVQSRSQGHPQGRTSRSEVLAHGLRPVAASTERWRVARPLLAAAAVAVLLAGAAWLWSVRRERAQGEFAPSGAGAQVAERSASDPQGQSPAQPQPERSNSPERAPAQPVESLDALEPDAELLAQLELLEAWDLITDEQLDLEAVGIDEHTLLGLSVQDDVESTGPGSSAPEAGEVAPADAKTPRNG